MCESRYTTRAGEALSCIAVSHPLVIAPHYATSTDGRRYHWSDGVADEAES
jgi:hypothetical protein